jgi:hypothetical protein
MKNPKKQYRILVLRLNYTLKILSFILPGETSMGEPDL